MTDRAVFDDTLFNSTPVRPDRVVEELEIIAPLSALRLKYPPRRDRLTFQYHEGARPCLFERAFAIHGDTIALIDGSSLPAGRATVCYQTN
ncbi:MAG: hypothetical protein P4L80_12095 [Xanthobacteraceae bacterium]|nr:hypothetical protein [Xanthobacteraceae bacterium]